MSYDLRYDGPDVEGEVSARTQQMLMGATMVGDGLSAGREARRGRRDALAGEAQAEALAADQAVWRDTPPRHDLGALSDAGIAGRWEVCAARTDQAEANTVRVDLEAELASRDPETMRDYRSWRNAAGLPPGEAMRRALAEREQRLRACWQPLLGDGAGGMDAAEVADRWAAAHAAHGTGEPMAGQLAMAREAGQARLAELDPDLVRAWTALQAEQPSTVQGLGARPGLTQAEAACRVAGKAGAFLPTPGGDQHGWAKVAEQGVQVVSTAARTAAGATNPVTLGAQAAAWGAQHARHLANRAMQP